MCVCGLPVCGHAFDGFLMCPPSSQSCFQLILFVEREGMIFNDTHRPLTLSPALPHPAPTLPLWLDQCCFRSAYFGCWCGARSARMRCYPEAVCKHVPRRGTTKSGGRSVQGLGSLGACPTVWRDPLCVLPPSRFWSPWLHSRPGRGLPHLVPPPPQLNHHHHHHPHRRTTTTPTTTTTPCGGGGGGGVGWWW